MYYLINQEQTLEMSDQIQEVWGNLSSQKAVHCQRKGIFLPLSESAPFDSQINEEEKK